MENIVIENLSGYAQCKASFGTFSVVCDNISIILNSGINILYGDIDSGNWAVSYLLAMYFENSSYMQLETGSLKFKNSLTRIDSIVDNSCYLDRCCTLYKSKSSVRKQIEEGIRFQKSNMSSFQICKLFGINEERFERPLSGVGNEKWRCMAAIGYAYGKCVFCFPWLSKRQVGYYGANLTDVLLILRSLNVITLLPTNFHFERTLFDQIYDFEYRVHQNF